MDNLNNGWIKVKDKLPEQGKDVLIFVPTLNSYNRKFIDIAWLDDSSNGILCFVGTDFGFNLPAVTHWQPLPEPPTINS